MPLLHLQRTDHLILRSIAKRVVRQLVFFKYDFGRFSKDDPASASHIKWATDPRTGLFHPESPWTPIAIRGILSRRHFNKRWKIQLRWRWLTTPLQAYLKRTT